MKKITLSLIITLLMVSAAYAIPTLQTYSPGSTAGDYYYYDQDTWFVSGSPFALYVVGAYDPNMTDLTGVTLLISVPNGETGTISITRSDESEIVPLLTQIGMGSSSETNPMTNADITVLNGITPSGYSTTSFLPFNANNHYPLQNDISDFILFDLYDFDDIENNLSDYNADDGSITGSTALGEIKEYLIDYTGFSSLHIDAYGLVTDEQGQKIATSWEMNPGSHDTTATVPEPSTLFLLGSGLLSLGFFSRKK